MGFFTSRRQYKKKLLCFAPQAKWIGVQLLHGPYRRGCIAVDYHPWRHLELPAWHSLHSGSFDCNSVCVFSSWDYERPSAWNHRGCGTDKVRHQHSFWNIMSEKSTSNNLNVHLFYRRQSIPSSDERNCLEWNICCQLKVWLCKHFKY